MLALSGVSASYGSVPAIHNVSIEIGEGEAVGLIGKLSQRGLTIVIVEHVMRAIMAVARHIVVLDHGQKIAEGTPKEIVENPEVVRAYLGSYVHPPTAGEH